MTSDGASQPRGMAPERTALAWSRTGLALLGAGLIVGRLALSSLGLAVVVTLLCGCELASVLAGWR